MPRSRVNGNFIDKTSSIVANILLRIIPTTSREKRHLLIIEMVRFDSFFAFFSPTYTSVLRKREGVGIERTKFVKQTNPRFGKVRRTNNSFRRVSSIDAASDTSILDLSIERKVTPTGYGMVWITGQSYSISIRRQHRGEKHYT
uniref:Uncharacterized protein n=1 Tax=Aegilops tauschii subsp. strangulata TaxID=200361 RepID=A0A452YMC2_AEGTS